MSFLLCMNKRGNIEVVVGVNETRVQFEEINKTLYYKDEEIENLKAELDEVKKQRNTFVSAVELNLDLRKERDALNKLVDFMSAGNREHINEMKALKGSLASAQRELSEMKSIDGATEVGYLQRELAETRNELNFQKRKVVSAVAERDKALNHQHEMRLQIDDAQNKRKREFFYKH